MARSEQEFEKETKDCERSFDVIQVKLAIASAS